jgi:hypothetical protein
MRGLTFFLNPYEKNSVKIPEQNSKTGLHQPSHPTFIPFSMDMPATPI